MKREALGVRGLEAAVPREKARLRGKKPVLAGLGRVGVTTPGVGG